MSEIVAIICPIPGMLGNKSIVRVVYDDGRSEDISADEAKRRGFGVVAEPRRYAS